ncbi:maestro heat-like repeat-containing protein family member 2A [Rhynchocyon petersi]
MHKALELVIIKKKANKEPSTVINILTHCLQMPEMEVYLNANVASDTLMALSRNHFSLVMCEMQHHLKPFKLTKEFVVIITLANLANEYVFEFMPYMSISLATIFTMLRLANEAKMHQVIWGTLETCEKVQFYRRDLEEDVSSVMSEEQFPNKLFPFYHYFVTTWLKKEHAKMRSTASGGSSVPKPCLALDRMQDAESDRYISWKVKLEVKCLKPMMNFRLPNDDLRGQIYDYILLVLAEYQSSVEALFITQVLRQILEVVVITNTPIPHMQLHLIFMELHTQVCSQVSSQEQSSRTKQRSCPASSPWVSLCELRLAWSCLLVGLRWCGEHGLPPATRSYPEKLMNFFLSQMETNKEAILVGTLTLIKAIVGADVGYQDQAKGWGLKYVSVQLKLSTCKLEIWVGLVCYILEADFSKALILICSDLIDLGFLYWALRVSLATGLDAEKVEVLLLYLLMKIDYDNAFEREGQVLTVLNALGDFEEKIQESVYSLQLGIWQLVHLFYTRLDILITTKIIQHYSSSCQDISLKMAFMKGIIEIARALKIVERLEDFEFVQKTTMNSIIMDILKDEPAECLASPVWTRALDALLHLSKLKPLYVGAENKEVMDIVFHSVISLMPPDEDSDSTKMLYTDSMRALEELMENLMQWQLDPKMLQEMVQIPLKLGQFGSLVGVIAPCTCDSHQRIRVASIDCPVQPAGPSWSTSKDKEFLNCKEHLGSCEEERGFDTSARISRVVCTEFSSDEVVSLIQKLCDNIGTLDLQHDKVAEIVATILAHLRRVDHPEILCTINLLLDKVDQDHSLPDILPELVYTLLLQLGSSH